MGTDEPGGSELLARVQVVDGASLHFRDFSQDRHDNWEIEWEATPAPVARSAAPTGQPTLPAKPRKVGRKKRSAKPPPSFLDALSDAGPLVPDDDEPTTSTEPALPAERPLQPIPKTLPAPVYVPAPDATPAPAPRQSFTELGLDDLEEVEEVEEIEEPADTFPPLPDVPPQPMHQLHPPGHVAPGRGDGAPTWDPPAEREGLPPMATGGHLVPEPEPPRAPEPGGYALPPEFTGPPRGQRAGVQAVDALPVVFEGISPRKVEQAVDHFDIFQVKAGTQLISQGEKYPALVMVLGGELVAERGDTRRFAGEGECLGFTTLFGDGIWATTVRARTPSRLLVLSLEGFRALRAQGSVVSVAIEEYALNLMMDGLDRARQRVAQLSTGQPMETFVPKPKFFELLADALGMGGIMAARCDAVKALSASPLFRNAEPAHLQAIAQRMVGLKAQAGSFFLKQGDANASMFLVVSGQVDVITSGSNDKAVRHETLGPGELFGIWAMLRDMPSRTTVIARTKCVVLELEKLGWAELAPAHTGTGSVLRLAVLRALTSRLVRESARLASLEAGHAPRLEATESGSFVTINPIDRR